MPANCIAWNVGHLAWQEQRYWLTRGQKKTPREDVAKQFAYGAEASTPSLAETVAAWREITGASDPFLDEMTTEKLQTNAVETKDFTTTWGNFLQRMIYHYWYHAGEIIGIRQALGHTNLAEFIGDIDIEAPYRPH